MASVLVNITAYLYNELFCFDDGWLVGWHLTALSAQKGYIMP